MMISRASFQPINKLEWPNKKKHKCFEGQKHTNTQKKSTN